MNLASLQFLAFIAVAIVAFHAHPAVVYRRAVLTIANAVFIASYLTNVTQVLPMLGFLTLGYAALQAMQRRAPAYALAVGVAAILAVYIVLKRFAFIEPYVALPFPYLGIGLSYILFRVIHLMVDARSGDLPGRIGPLAFFRYTCNFLCFVSGPIQRYQDFATRDGIAVEPLDHDRVYAAFARIVTGYIKFIVIAASVDYVFVNNNATLLATSPVAYVHTLVLYGVSAVSYTIYLYYNFSGYMDIVIGIGLLLGQTVPENFNKPFAARSFLEFWQRWHMTLSDWFKLYLFNPLMFTLMARFPAPGATAALGVLAFFVTFLVMGMWHGTTLVFVVYGLLMGAGASINKMWQVVCTKRLGKKRYRALSQTTAYVAFARGLTTVYFAMALTCLWKPAMADFSALCNSLGALGIVAVFVGLSISFAILSLALDWTSAILANQNFGWRSVAANSLARNLALGGKILVILVVAVLFSKAPDFVYKAF